MPILLKIIQKIKDEGILPNSLWDQHYSDTKAKYGHYKKRKLQIIIPDEYRYKILANWIQQQIKRTIHYEQVGFIPGMQGWFNICKSTDLIYHIYKRKKLYDHVNMQKRQETDRIAHFCHFCSAYYWKS